MFKEVNSCHICFGIIKVKKKEEVPSICPFCGTDLANPAAEILRDSIECEHIKGFLGIAPGELCVTNKRLFWVKREEDLGVDDEGRAFGNPLVQGITRKGAGTVQVSIPLDGIAKVDDCKKGLRKGVTVHAKSGGAYNFFCSKPQELKDFLAPYAAG
jgi:hypothetical protein